MKTRLSHFQTRQGGWALLAVMTLCATLLMCLAAVMSWTNENSNVVSRNNEFFATSYASEAATEKPLASIIADFENYGEALVYSKMSTYAALVPTSTDDPYWTNFQFSGGSVANTVIVTNISQVSSIVLGPPYSGLNCQGATFEVIADAYNKYSNNKNSGGTNIVTTVGQQIFLGQIPIFQFAVFYQDTMEIDPGATMNVSGLVHGNNSIYADPNSGVTLTFGGDVSSSGNVYLSENPLDPTTARPASPSVNFNGNHVSGVNPLNLPVGTNTSGTTTNIGANVDGILQVPPAGESPTSATGTNRLYNKADIIILISNDNTISVTSGVNVNNQATVISNSQWSVFLNTNNFFTNQRDNAEVLPVNIDEGNLRQWSATNTVLRPLLSSLRGSGQADVQSVYVADMRYLTNVIVTTSYTTNTNYVSTNTVGYPLAGSYQPPVATNTVPTNTAYYPSASQVVGSVVTNITPTTTSTLPGSGTYLGTITTNTSSTTTSSYPTGNYIGAVTTNTTPVTSGTYPTGNYVGAVTTNTAWVYNSTTAPAAGTYTGSVTRSGSYGNYRYTYDSITGYTYNQITGYTYNAITGYSYSKITSYTYNGVTGYTYSAYAGLTIITNYTTNYVQIGEPGVVLTNGAYLPPGGLSVVTPDPAYIVGNWNIQTNTSGNQSAQTTNTAYTHPSGIYADALTVLSPNWNPNNSGAALSSRTATADTVNAAILTGIVPSDGNNYSGGVENFPRFLENWSGINFYYNGSMVEMFSSQIANSPWPGTGVVYNPPTRDWAFDQNFTNPSKLPPLTPSVLYFNRAQWSMLPPYTMSF